MAKDAQCRFGLGTIVAFIFLFILVLGSGVMAQVPDWCPTTPIPVCADGPGPVCASLVIPEGITIEVDGATWTEGTLCFQADSSGTYLFHVTASFGGIETSCDLTVLVSFGTAPQIICPEEPYQLFLCAPGKVCFTVPTKNAALVQATGGEMTDSTLCVQVDSSGLYSVTVIASNACGFDTCTISARVTVGSKPFVGCIDSILTVDICEFTEICVPFVVTGADSVTSSLGSWHDGQLCFTPDTAGYYIISVTGTNSCGSSTCGASVQVVKHEKPAIIVPFTPPWVQTCYPGQVCAPLLIERADNVQVGGGEWNRDTICFTADTSGYYTFDVIASNECGADTVRGFGVNVTVVGAPVLTCPEMPVEITTCDTIVCIDFPLVAVNADSVRIAGATLVEGKLCFLATEDGDYNFTATAYNLCTETSCSFTIRYRRLSAPLIHCPLIEQVAHACQPGDTVCLDLPIDNADLVTVAGVEGAYWSDGRLCFVTDSASVYTMTVAATNGCGTVECAVFVNAQFAVTPHITCPTDSLIVKLCGSSEVCIDLPISNATGVFLDGASWEDGRLCFATPEPGYYDITVVALGDCANDTCTVHARIEAGAAPEIDCWQEDPENLILCAPGEARRPIGGRISGADSVLVIGGSYVDGNLCFPADTAGLYYQTVIAINDCGVDTCVFFSIVEFASVPEACFTATTGSEPLEVQFAICTEEFRAGFRWNFGDDDSFYVDLGNPSHRYAAAGCYAVTMIAGNWCGVDTLIDTVCVTDSQLVVPTDQWISIYCDAPTFHGSPLHEGDIIAAFDPQGVLCGMEQVRADGSFGFMPIYRDDQFSTEDEGATPGDLIHFTINGQPAFTNPPVIWTAMGDRIQACVFGTEDCRSLHLRAGWNLVSWNVAYHSEIATALGDINGCVDVVLGFDRGGRTFDPALPEYSTLADLDYHYGYWFKMKCDADLNLCGISIAPDDLIMLYSGWNLVSYWPADSLTVEQGFASILSYTHLAYTFDDAIRIWRDTQPQFNTLTHLKPGLGYWVRCDVNGALAYPGYGLGGAPVIAADPLADIPPSRTWMSIYGSNLQIDGVPVASGTLVEAFTQVGIPCGQGIYENGLLKFMPVYGYEDVAMPMRLYPAEGDPVILHIGGVRVYPDLTMQSSGSRLRTENFSLTPTEVGESGSLPKQFALIQNYPNPFNPTTLISFDLPVGSPVRIDLYNALGQKIRTLADGTYHAGRHAVQWDGTDGGGRSVSGGVYIYRMQAGAYTESRKMLLVK